VGIVPQSAIRIHRPHSFGIVLSNKWGCPHRQQRSLPSIGAVRHDRQSTRPGAGLRKRLRLLFSRKVKEYGRPAISSLSLLNTPSNRRAARQVVACHCMRLKDQGPNVKRPKLDEVYGRVTR
jgi:hypothetical protein